MAPKLQIHEQYGHLNTAIVVKHTQKNIRTAQVPAFLLACQNCNSDVLEKLLVAQRIKKFSAINGIRRRITVFKWTFLQFSPHII
jgi:hypothetical protein